MIYKKVIVKQKEPDRINRIDMIISALACGKIRVYFPAAGSMDRNDLPRDRHSVLLPRDVSETGKH